MSETKEFFSLLPDNFDPDLSDRPLWLLDIDGVVNAYAYGSRKKYGTPAQEKDAYQDYRDYQMESESGTFYTFWVADSLVRDINQLHDSGLVEIAWLTTWEWTAQENVAPALGLPLFPVAGSRHMRRSDYYWKGRSAVESLRLNRPVVWTDDDEIQAHHRLRFKDSGIPHLFVVPEPSYGLTPADLHRIEDFIAGF